MICLPGGESNPGLPRDRRGYSPLYYRGFSYGQMEFLTSYNKCKAINDYPLTRTPDCSYVVKNTLRCPLRFVFKARSNWCELISNSLCCLCRQYYVKAFVL